jgi:hypothetical protein
MWPSRVKQTFRAVLRVCRHIIESGVVHPALGSIFGKREALQTVVGDIFIKVEQNSQAGLRHDRMSRVHGNMVP